MVERQIGKAGLDKAEYGWKLRSQIWAQHPAGQPHPCPHPHPTTWWGELVVSVPCMKKKEVHERRPWQVLGHVDALGGCVWVCRLHIMLGRDLFASPLIFSLSGNYCGKPMYFPWLLVIIGSHDRRRDNANDINNGT